MSRPDLPEISPAELASRLAPFAPALPAGVVERLGRHYSELRRWNLRLGLIGPGTVDQIVERHYGESVAALSWIDARPEANELLDIGSGAGFPGLVLAICRPRLRVTLLESRERKAAFLRRSALAAGAGGVRVSGGFLDANLPDEVPERLDFVTLRAVKLADAAWRALLARLAPDGLVLQWSGPASTTPAGLREAGTAMPLAGGERRSIRAWVLPENPRAQPDPP